MGMEGRRRSVAAASRAADLRARSPCPEELQVVMNLTIKVWRQQDAKSAGKFVSYSVQNVTPDMSFLEMLDLLNEDLQAKGEAPVAFDHDCREGICGMCGFLINGVAHGGHRAMDAATCIGCGACVAACPNASAMLFTAAKIVHLNSLPQGQPQRDERTADMVAQMSEEHFGSCTNHGECEAVCPKKIPLEFIGRMNRDLIHATFHRRGD